MHVEELEERPHYEIVEWDLFFQEEPFGPYGDSYRASKIAQASWNPYDKRGAPAADRMFPDLAPHGSSREVKRDPKEALLAFAHRLASQAKEVKSQKSLDLDNPDANSKEARTSAASRSRDTSAAAGEDR